MNINTSYENCIKLLVIGDASVGKSNFISQFIEGQFSQSHLSTVGFDCRGKTVKIKDQKVKVQIWDTAGQERYHSVSKNLFLRVQGIIIIYDITNLKSFENLDTWVNSILESCDNIPLLIVGNKNDLETEREVLEEEGKMYAETHNALFLETSAKTGINIKESIMKLSEIIWTQGNKNLNASISLDSSLYPNKKKTCCEGKSK